MPATVICGKMFGSTQKLKTDRPSRPGTLKVSKAYTRLKLLTTTLSPNRNKYPDHSYLTKSSTGYPSRLFPHSELSALGNA